MCLSLALSQSASAPTAAMFLSSWLTPPLSMTLTVTRFMLMTDGNTVHAHDSDGNTVHAHDSDGNTVYVHDTDGNKVHVHD